MKLFCRIAASACKSTGVFSRSWRRDISSWMPQVEQRRREVAKAENEAMLAVSPKSEVLTWQANTKQLLNLPFPSVFFASSQCKRPESRISSNIFSTAVFSALIASLRFRGRLPFGCGSAAPSLWREVLVREISASISVICGCRLRTPDF